MSETPPVGPEEQEFLALLVHRGFLGATEARRVLAVADELGGFAFALASLEGWDEKRVAFLRRTRALQDPEIPGYAVERRIGRGGTAEVFSARRAKDGRRVALKILQPKVARDSAGGKRFLAEAKLLQELDHPGIVRGHRAFRFAGTLVMEMEYIEGHTLQELLDMGKEFSESETIGFILQTARALEELNEKGIVHRDLKPDNLMLDSSEKIRLIDLGFAGTGMEGSAGEGATLGTVAYLAPEQAEGKASLDGRADIYSLGVTLYRLALGELPFDSDDDRELMRRHILEGLRGGTMKSGRVSPRLHYLLEKMMAKDPDLRYNDPAELATDIIDMGDF